MKCFFGRCRRHHVQCSTYNRSLMLLEEEGKGYFLLPIFEAVHSLMTTYMWTVLFQSTLQMFTLSLKAFCSVRNSHVPLPLHIAELNISRWYVSMGIKKITDRSSFGGRSITEYKTGVYEPHLQNNQTWKPCATPSAGHQSHVGAMVKY